MAFNLSKQNFHKLKMFELEIMNLRQRQWENVVDFVQCRYHENNTYTLFDGLAYNTCGYFASCVVFFPAPQGPGGTRPRVPAVPVSPHPRIPASPRPRVSASHVPRPGVPKSHVPAFPNPGVPESSRPKSHVPVPTFSHSPSCGSLIPFTRANAQWVIHGFNYHLNLHFRVNSLFHHRIRSLLFHYKRINYFAIGFYLFGRVFRNTLIPSVKMTLTIEREIDFSTRKKNCYFGFYFLVRVSKTS